MDPAPKALSGVINTYFPGTESVAAGATSVPVGDLTGEPVKVEPGDLLLVVQMTGAAIRPSNNDRYGDGVRGEPASGATSLGNAGRYEYAVAAGPISDGFLPISGSGPGGGLLAGYEHADVDKTTGAKRFQVVRVPTYPDVTLDYVLARPWDGSTGGVVAFDVAGTIDLAGGTVNASEAGFRGGVGLDRGTDSSTVTDSFEGSKGGGGKGEGVVGTPRFVWNQLEVRESKFEGVPAGSFGTGAPANAGGGGQIRAGGGGGANGGAGGAGSGDPGAVHGGAGGVATGKDAARLHAGGGGGGSQQPVGSDAGSMGGSGGGIVLLRAAGVVGAGTIVADGGAGADGTDGKFGGTGGGGGGAGGTVVLSAGSSTLDGVTISATGGGGGGAPKGLGGGGGGGGGVVLASRKVGSLKIDGGAAGPDAEKSTATPGSPGIEGSVSSTDLSGEPLGVGCRSALMSSTQALEPTIVAGSGTPARWIVTVVNLANRPELQGVRLQVTLPPGMTFASINSFLVDGGATHTAKVFPSGGETVLEIGEVTLPGGSWFTVEFSADTGKAELGRYDLAVSYSGSDLGVRVAGGDAGTSSAVDDVEVVEK